jgi:hypothetical protein
MEDVAVLTELNISMGSAKNVVGQVYLTKEETWKHTRSDQEYPTSAIAVIELLNFALEEEKLGI